MPGGRPLPFRSWRVGSCHWVQERRQRIAPFCPPKQASIQAPLTPAKHTERPAIRLVLGTQRMARSSSAAASHRTRLSCASVACGFRDKSRRYVGGRWRDEWWRWRDQWGDCGEHHLIFFDCKKYIAGIGSVGWYKPRSVRRESCESWWD